MEWHVSVPAMVPVSGALVPVAAATGATAVITVTTTVMATEAWHEDASSRTLTSMLAGSSVIF